MRCLSLLPAVLLCLPTAVRSAESLDGCLGYIDSVPATIATQGTWCLRADLATSMASGVAITVAANNVTIDCNGFKLGGLGAGQATQATGIQSFDRSNVTVRHCNVRGFMAGIALDGANGGGHLVEDNLVDASRLVGIRLEGPHGRVHRNRVLNTESSRPNLYGILADGDIIDNLVGGMSTSYGGAGPQLVAIVFSGNGTQARGNRVRGQRVANTAATATGIQAIGQRQSITANHLAVVPVGAGSGVVGAGSGSTFCLDNQVAGYDTAALSNCASAGNAAH